jgi:hypothetical protein
MPATKKACRFGRAQGALPQANFSRRRAPWLAVSPAHHLECAALSKPPDTFPGCLDAPANGRRQALTGKLQRHTGATTE